jgi:hypothetical protein
MSVHPYQAAFYIVGGVAIGIIIWAFIPQRKILRPEPASMVISPGQPSVETKRASMLQRIRARIVRALTWR